MEKMTSWQQTYSVIIQEFSLNIKFRYTGELGDGHQTLIGSIHAENDPSDFFIGKLEGGSVLRVQDDQSGREQLI